MPISVTNSIEEKDDRPSCDALSNDLLSFKDVDSNATNEVDVLFAPGDATEVESTSSSAASITASVGFLMGLVLIF